MDQDELVAKLIELQKTIPQDEFEALVKQLIETGALKTDATATKTSPPPKRGMQETNITIWGCIRIVLFFVLIGGGSIWFLTDESTANLIKSDTLRYLIAPLVGIMCAGAMFPDTFGEPAFALLTAIFLACWGILGWFRRLLIPLSLFTVLGCTAYLFQGKLSIPLSPVLASVGVIALGVPLGSVFGYVARLKDNSWWIHSLGLILTSSFVIWSYFEVSSESSWGQATINATISFILALRAVRN